MLCWVSLGDSAESLDLSVHFTSGADVRSLVVYSRVRPRISLAHSSVISVRFPVSRMNLLTYRTIPIVPIPPTDLPCWYHPNMRCYQCLFPIMGWRCPRWIPNHLARREDRTCNDQRDREERIPRSIPPCYYQDYQEQEIFRHVPRRRDSRVLHVSEEQPTG